LEAPHESRPRAPEHVGPAVNGHAGRRPNEGREKGHHQETAEPKKKGDDKGYKSALDRIPDQKFDPWGKVR
jgi:hypothetical protein